MSKRLNSSLLFIAFIALVLRVVGITYGFPFIFHPDEPSVIRTALGLRFFPNPDHFDWPHLYFYVNYFLYMIFAKVRVFITPLKDLFPLVWNDELIFYLLTRVLSALLGALTIIPVYFIGRNLFNRRIGLLSALIFALLPFHIKHSHYALIDVPMVFLLTWALFFASQVYLWGENKYYLLFGLFAGLAASTKYNGALIILSLLLAHVFRVVEARESLFSIKAIKGLFIAAVASVLGFLVGTPFALLDYSTFLITDGPKGALWQFANVGKVPFIEQIKQFIDALLFKISDDTGYTFMSLFAMSILLLIFKSQRRHLSRLLFLVIPAIVYLFYISGFEKNRSHYYLISYPFIAILAAFAFSEIADFFKKKNALFSILFTIIIFSIPLFLIFKDDYELTQQDTRVLLYNWLDSNIQTTDQIYYGSNVTKQVTDKFTLNVSDRFDNSSVLTNKSGFIIVSADDTLELEQLKAINAQIESEVVFEPNLRKGPQLFVYSFNKNVEKN